MALMMPAHSNYTRNLLRTTRPYFLDSVKITRFLQWRLAKRWLLTKLSLAFTQGKTEKLYRARIMTSIRSQLQNKLIRHPGESRGPEDLENTGYRLYEHEASLSTV
jgi:hypothetical protein